LTSKPDREAASAKMKTTPFSFSGERQVDTRVELLDRRHEWRTSRKRSGHESCSEVVR
jgi:hypothetical protein